MRKVFTKFILLFLTLFLSAMFSCAAPVVKITGLELDNSDGFVIVKSIGQISTATQSAPENDVNNEQIQKNTITKGFLTNPDRIFVDISNAILAGNAQNYIVKNSVFQTVKISQFSTNPHVVRIVFAHDKALNPNDLAVWANDRQILIKYKNNLPNSEKFKTIYNNMTTSERIADIFEPITYTQETKELVQNVSDTKNPQEEILIGEVDKILHKPAVYKTTSSQKETKLKSAYYLDAVMPLDNGIMLKGQGLISLKNSFVLQDPLRVVYDIENATVAQNLRNKTFAIPNSQALVINGVVTSRDILRVGQNSSNIARLVIQGDNAKDYRLVFSPDLQGIFLARRQSVLNSKLTQTTSNVLSYQASVVAEKLGVLTVSFSSPVVLTMFEENSNFYIDLQNVSDFNSEAFSKLSETVNFSDVTVQKIASEKTRLTFPTKKEVAINAQISPDAKELRVYFKQREPKKQAVQSEIIIEEKPKQKEPKKPKPSTIKQMYKVVIDAGHGGADVGATRDNIYEKDITLNVSKMLEKYLTKQGVYTHMVRDTDKTVELSERSDFSNSISPDVFVSVHVNSSVKDEIFGVETHWYKEDSLDYAQKVHAHLASNKNIARWETIDRGLFRSKFYVINHTEAPAILVEIGFISNEAERKLLLEEKRQEEIAKAIAEGIMEYLKLRK